MTKCSRMIERTQPAAALWFKRCGLRRRAVMSTVAGFVAVAAFARSDCDPGEVA
jgi:hypothetical protein